MHRGFGGAARVTGARCRLLQLLARKREEESKQREIDRICAADPMLRELQEKLNLAYVRAGDAAAAAPPPSPHAGLHARGICRTATCSSGGRTS